MQDLSKLKYAELRKLAKKAGIKANLKVCEILLLKTIIYLSPYFATSKKLTSIFKRRR